MFPPESTGTGAAAQVPSPGPPVGGNADLRSKASVTDDFFGGTGGWAGPVGVGQTDMVRMGPGQNSTRHPPCLRGFDASSFGRLKPGPTHMDPPVEVDSSSLTVGWSWGLMDMPK